MKKSDTFLPVFLAFALAATLWAGTKPFHPTIPSMVYKNNAIGVHITNFIGTNDNVTVTWYYEDFVKDDTLTIAIAPKSEKDEDSAFMTIYEGPVWGQEPMGSDLMIGSWAGVIENATNMAMRIGSYYLPPIVVHTNGVYHLDVRYAMDEDFEINTNKVIAPIGFERK